MIEAYTDTSGQLAREGGCTVQTVIKYADEGLLDVIRSSNGVRLFRSGQGARVREILADRLAARGKKRA
jgi:DNA-binding transcriptional MerR regulator